MSDDPRFTGYWAAIRADLNKQTVDAVIRLADNEQEGLRARLDQAEARVDQLTDERDELRARIAKADWWMSVAERNGATTKAFVATLQVLLGLDRAPFQIVLGEQ